MISEIKLDAKSKLKGNFLKIWGMILLIGLISYVIKMLPALFGVEMTNEVVTNVTGMDISISKNNSFGNIWSIVTTGVSFTLSYCLSFLMLNIVRENKVTYEDCFKILKNNVITVLAVSFLCSIFITLGFACLIIPGIIVAIGLSMVNYVMIDNPNMDIFSVIKESWNIMKGHKLEYFMMMLSFIGWILLCLFIFPIIYVWPYIILSIACFYNKIK